MIGALRSRSTACASARGGGMSPGRLVICPTPIGNLEDVTLRVLAALRDADIVACEDTRRSRVLLDRYGVGGSLVSYHEHNERARAAELVSKMREGAVVALVSDAGTPLVSDPGFVLVQACVAAGLAVEVLPGPSARWRRWSRARYPPTGGGSPGSCRARRARCEAVFRARPRRWSRSSRPSGWRRHLQVLAELDPERPVAVCRELTKLHEEIVPRDRGRAGGPVRVRAAARRGRARRRWRPVGRATRSGPALERCARWSTPAPSRGRPRRSCRS